MLKSLKVLFVGLGSIGKRHLRNLTDICKDCNIDLTVDALRHTKSSLGDIASLINNEYYSTNDLPDYDVIFITNPSNLHYKVISELNSKAKAFFIEKPLDVLPLDNDQINTLDKNKIYYVACPLRHTAVFKVLSDYIKDKKVYCARAICSSYLPDWRKGVDYRTIYSAKAESGGVKIDLIHEFDYLFTLFGFPQKHCMFERKISNLEIQSPDYVSFIGDYDDKFIELHLDYFGREVNRVVEIYTPDDVILCDFIKSKLRINGEYKDFCEDTNTRYINEIKYFLGLLSTQNENINDIINANTTLKFITEK